MLEKAGGRAHLLVQSTSADASTFVRISSVIVIEATQDWDRDALRTSLTAAAGRPVDHGAAWRRLVDGHSRAALYRTSGRPRKPAVRQPRPPAVPGQRCTATERRAGPCGYTVCIRDADLCRRIPPLCGAVELRAHHASTRIRRPAARLRRHAGFLQRKPRKSQRRALAGSGDQRAGRGAGLEHSSNSRISIRPAMRREPVKVK